MSKENEKDNPTISKELCKAYREALGREIKDLKKEIRNLIRDLGGSTTGE